MPQKPIQPYYLQYQIKAKARKPLTCWIKGTFISRTFCMKIWVSINLKHSTDYKRACNSLFLLFFSGLGKKEKKEEEILYIFSSDGIKTVYICRYDFHTMQHVYIAFLCYYQLFSECVFYATEESIKISSSFLIFQDQGSPGLSGEFNRGKQSLRA